VPKIVKLRLNLLTLFRKKNWRSFFPDTVYSRLKCGSLFICLILRGTLGLYTNSEKFKTAIKIKKKIKSTYNIHTSKKRWERNNLYKPVRDTLQKSNTGSHV